MDPPMIIIDPRVFRDMIVSAIQWFEDECLSTVYGTRPTAEYNRYTITDLLIHERTLRRKNTEIKISGIILDRFEKLFHEIPFFYGDNMPLGNFHSHAKWRTEKQVSDRLSEQDIRDMIERNTELEIIIAIWKKPMGATFWRSISHRAHNTHGLIGSITDYNFRIRAWRVTDTDTIPTEQEIFIPENRNVMRLLEKNKKIIQSLPIEIGDNFLKKINQQLYQLEKKRNHG